MNLRSVLFLMVLLAISSILSAHTIGLTCDPVSYDSEPYTEQTGTGISDNISPYISSETHDPFNDGHAKQVAQESRREEYNNKPEPNNERTFSQSSGSSRPSSFQYKKESPFLKEKITQFNASMLREIPNDIQFTSNAKFLLKSLGLNYLEAGGIRSYGDVMRIALYNWIVHVVNCVAELCYDDPPTVAFKHAIKQILIICDAAHTLLAEGETTKVGNLIKLAITAVHKYDEYRKEFRRARLDRVQEIMRKPHEFIEEQVDGLCWSVVLFGKTLVNVAHLTVSQEFRRDFFHSFTNFSQKSWALVSDIYKMSPEEWDQAFLQASNALGGLHVDFAITAGIGYYVPLLFSEIPGRVPQYLSTEIAGGGGNLAHVIDMIYDPIQKTYVVDQKIVPVMKTAVEIVRKVPVAPSLPAVIINAAEQAGTTSSSTVAASAAVNAVSKVTSAAEKVVDVEKSFEYCNKKLAPLGLGSTGRTEPINLIEKLAMEEIMSNPESGKIVELTKGMTDIRWPKDEGWIKMAWNYTKAETKIEIHYVAQYKDGIITAVDDFKFINKKI